MTGGHGERPMALGELTGVVQSRLRSAGVPDAGRQARRLIGAVAGIAPETFLVRPEMQVGCGERQRVEQALAKHLSRMPVGRIVGQRDFYGRAFRLGPATLEPRPDSEVLIDATLEVIAQSGRTNEPLRIVDVGTGSGCLLITLLAELPQATGTGSDLSGEALAIAKQNAEMHGVADRASFVRSDALEGIGDVFDILVSNPPYLRSDEIDGLDAEVRDYDPVLALDGGCDGLEVYRKIGRDAGRVVPNGWMIFEVGAGMADAVCLEIDRFANNDRSGGWRMWQDINSHIRCVALATQFDTVR